MESEVPEQYLKAMENSAHINYEHPIVEEILGKYYGFLIFQESLAELAHKLGEDISLEDGNELRKVLTKKGTGKEDKIKTSLYFKFINGCRHKGLTSESADKLWKKMEAFAKYRL